MTLLETRNLSFSYQAERPILKSVSLAIESGKVVALVGPNGSGKTTLLRVLAGLEPRIPATAPVFFRGEPLLPLSERERAKKVSYLGNEPAVQFPIRAREAVSLGAFAREAAGSLAVPGDAVGEVETVMKECLCWDLRDRAVASLSGGESQRVALARARLQRAPVLLLDEALSRLDLHHQAEAGRLLRRWSSAGLAILLVSHDLNLGCEWADEVLLFRDGGVLARGTPGEVLTSENLAKLYPGLPLMITTPEGTCVPKVFFGQK